MTTKNWLGDNSPIVYVIGSIEGYRYDGDSLDWLYLPMRWLPVARPADTFVLPDVWPLREFAPFVEETLLGGCPLQIIWVSASHYLLDRAIASNPAVIGRLQELAQERAVFVPYTAATSEFRDWFARLGDAGVCGELPEWGDRFATKEILHPWADEPDGQSLAQLWRLPAPGGYNAKHTQELLEAWCLLQRGGVTRVGIKPLRGAFGDGIIPLTGLDPEEVATALRRYPFSHGPVALEEWLEIDSDPLGEISWSTHYIGPRLFAPPTRQLVQNGVSVGNITPGFEEALSNQLNGYTQRLIGETTPQGVGGFNGPVVNGIPYLTDVNTGRLTGVCSSLAFREQFCPEAITLNRKLGSPRMDVWTAWALLQQAGIAFDLTRGWGVAIQGWLPSGWSQVIACSPSLEETLDLFGRARKVLEM